MKKVAREKLADQIEARVTQYVHRARRQVLDIFGPENAHEHVPMTLQLAEMMVELEGAEIIALSNLRAAEKPKKKGA